MPTQIGKYKQQKIKLPVRKKKHAVKSIKRMRVVSCPKRFNGKPGYIENIDTPWIQSPHTKIKRNEFEVAIAHEMRNPLTAISLSAELIRDAIETDDDVIMCANTILRSAARVNNLIIRFLVTQSFAKAT